MRKILAFARMTDFVARRADSVARGADSAAVVFVRFVHGAYQAAARTRLFVRYFW